MSSKIDVNDLQVGMYVARLDRPWLDTPFLFQGFYIRSANEIEEIKAHCDYVFISAASAPAASVPIRPSSGNGTRPTLKVAKKARFSGLLKFWRQRPGPAEVADPEHGVVLYPETESLSSEMRCAAGVHIDATKTVRGVMDELSRSGSLDLRSLQTTIEPMVDSVLRNPAALACLMRIQKKGNYLYHHSIASAVWATVLGRQIGLSRDDLAVVALGAMLLDVGKTRLPDDLLSKPDKLDLEETKLVRLHVKHSIEILQNAGDVDSRVLDMVAHHHERHNGTGYPNGLSGNAIPVFGRIAGIVDAYDAMITLRPYATLMSSYDALRKLRKVADVEFQVELVEQFTRAIGVFPTGTLVELNTGEIAVVTKQNRIRRLRPEIMIVMDEQKRLLENFHVLDLNEETVAREGEQSLWIEHGLPPGSHGIDPAEFFLD